MPSPNKAERFIKRSRGRPKKDRYQRAGLTIAHEPELTCALIEAIGKGIPFIASDGQPQVLTIDRLMAIWAEQVEKGNHHYFREMIQRLDGLIHLRLATKATAEANANHLHVHYVNDWRGKEGEAEPEPGEPAEGDPAALPAPGADIVSLPDEAFQLVDRGPAMAENDGGLVDRD